MNDNNSYDERDESQKPLGVLACLTTGFDVVARRPQLILAGVILDMFLWLGPRLSLEALIAPVVAQWPAPTPDVMPIYQLLNQAVDAMSNRFNFFSTLSLAPLLGVPTLMAGQLTLERPFGLRPEIVIPSVWALLGWALLLGVLGLVLNALYLVPLGRAVIEDTESSLPGPRSATQFGMQLVRLVLLLVGLLSVLSIPGFLLMLLLSGISAALANFVLMLGSTVGLYVLLQLLFVVPGLLQLRRSLLAAIQESLLLVRVDFVGTLNLLALALVLSWGLDYLWALADPASWVTLCSIGGHAFISTGLMATLLVYYQERLAYLRTLQRSFAAQAARSGLEA